MTARPKDWAFRRMNWYSAFTHGFEDMEVTVVVTTSHLVGTLMHNNMQPVTGRNGLMYELQHARGR